MGSLFRSEAMTLTQLYLQADSAYHCISELGELGLVQFCDLNAEVNAFQRKYVNEVRRCDEMERRLRFLKKETDTAGVPIVEVETWPSAPPPQQMMNLEAEFEDLERRMKETNANQVRLEQDYKSLEELRYTLELSERFFREAERISSPTTDPTEKTPLLATDSQDRRPLSFIAGVIRWDKLHTFERVLWRVSRGNVFMRYAEIDDDNVDPLLGDERVHKCVFMIFFQGPQLESRVKKICDGFGAAMYHCPKAAGERRDMLSSVATRLADVRTVLSQSADHRMQVLQSIANKLHSWTIQVKKIKAIYHTLNMCNVDITQQCLIAECWCPVSDSSAIYAALSRGQVNSGSTVQPVVNHMQTQKTPPTYNKVNKFTSGFQNIVDAYGVASYQEVNPTPFTIITFPFLFAVMFGDCGHGTIMMLFALYLVVNEKRLSFLRKGEITGTFYGGRYIILLMGLFSMYTGLIYNDCFSKSFNIFGSSWHVGSGDIVEDKSTVQLSIDHDFDRHNPYPFGLDPIWQLATNKLTFTNSFKMKLSVVLGVFQMSFGVVLSLFNYLYFRDVLNIFANFIPQILFLGLIFGYLTALIFFKWITIDSSFNASTGGAPSLLITLINMFLSPGSVKPENKLYEKQAPIQTCFVLLAVLCIPWMLLTKPLVLYIIHRLRFQPSQNTLLNANVNVEESSDFDSERQPLRSPVDGGKDEEVNFGDIFVHQAIHTIEFCLGCISNTASYLRLWALSLAHAELSEVLWTMMFHIGLHFGGGLSILVIFVTWVIWAALTVAILLIMEGLSAFLHALRLHWVEFQNKFYTGEGYKFKPFSFALLLDDSELE